MFVISGPEGTILLDPNDGIGYDRPVLTEADAIAITHNHFDHDKVEVGPPGTSVVRGVSDEEWVIGEVQRGDITLRTIGTYHDDQEGNERGKNAMFMLEAEGLRILHAGDLGHVLTEEQLQEVGEVDVLLLPVGGYFTIGPQEADQVIGQLSPKIVIPMHYGTDALKNFPDKGKLKPVDDFLRGKTNVVRADTNAIRISKDALPSDTVIVVLSASEAD